MVIFFAPQVRDVATGQIVAGLVGQSVTIVYPGTSDPVEITEYPSGVAIPGSVLTVGDTFSLASFNTPEGVYAVEALAANGTRVRLESAEGMRLAAEGARDAAAEAASAAQAAQAAAENATSPTWPIPGTPAVFPPIIGTTAGTAMAGDRNFDNRYYTKSQVDNLLSAIQPGGPGGGDATVDGIPSLIRYETGTPGTYPPRGTARTDLQITWIGTVPPPSATPDSGTDFVNSGTALSRGTGLGPDKFEAIPS